MGLFDGLFGKKSSAAPGRPAKPPAQAASTKSKGKVNLEKRFDMQGRTGQGSMSKMFRAFDRQLGRTVALKLLDKEKTAKFEARFVGKSKPPEGDICMGLKHKNIVKTFEWGVATTGETYLVMEWIDGQGLNFLVETRSPKLKGEEANYLAQIADSLEYLHRERFMHRDICPRNVMVTTDGVVKLIDFGLSIPYRKEFCEPGNRTGTPDYLAPEIIKRQATDHTVDLYALGVTAFELYTGSLPWPKAMGSMDALMKHINTAPRDVRELNPNLPDAVVRMINKGMAANPKDRYATAGDFREALKGLMRDSE